MTMPNARRLLVVDDDSSMLELVRAMLADTEWNVTGVQSGKEALARAQDQPYDVVLTDILMPGMDGLALLSELRARAPGIRVVVMTIRNTSDHILGSLRRDAAGYVSKPFTRDALIMALREAMSRPVETDDIQVLSDRPEWISLQIRCKVATADRLTQFMRELPGSLSRDAREEVATAFRELLMNAIEHGGHLDPRQTVDLSVIRTARTIVYYIRDPGEGFSPENLGHAATSNTPDEPLRHVAVRQQLGIRPGGFGMLMAKNFADELIYSAKGNEVILIKYL
jgi:CheY-like chemotaxis protein/anti-sigma regulatory factor (Ser/Thr protein kinase)